MTNKTASPQLSQDIVKDRAFIGGRWMEAKSGAAFDVVNPANDDVIASVPDMGAEETRDAISHADKAFKEWSKLHPSKRAEIMFRWSDLILRRADDLGLLMTAEQGKPFAEARGEVVAAAATVRHCAEEGKRLYGDFIEGAKEGTKIIVSRHPVGVVGAVTPWNFPVGMITRKVSPALAAGCTVVLKPAEATPLCALALAALAEEAGVPAGVLNIVTTAKAAPVGKALTSDSRVKKISFTGSTAVGKTLMAGAAEHVQKISLELGGNAPFIVFPSADLEKAVDGAIASKFRNAGQTCICANRIFVHEEVMDAFSALFLKKLKALKVGVGWEKDVAIGPLINEKAVEKIEKMLEQALVSGGKILTGGKRHIPGKTFFEPTLLHNVADDQPLAREEIFGPVAVLYSFASEEDLLRRANDTPYGLAGYVYSNDMGEVWRVSDGLEYGMIGVNEPLLSNDLSPFGGVKESGIGKEGGKYGLVEYTSLKYRLFGGF